MHFFLNPPPSGSDETRPQFIANVLLLAVVGVPVAVAGAVSLDPRSRAAAVRLDGGRHGRRVLRARRQVLLRAAGGAVRACRRCHPARSLGSLRRRLRIAGARVRRWSTLSSLPILLPVLPLHVAERHGVIKARGDYESEIGWPSYARLVERHAAGANVIVAANYGEAGALELFGHGLPPVASGDVTMRYWRPQVTGRRALVVGYSRRTATFCTGYSVVARIREPIDSDERGKPSPAAHCAARLPASGLRSSRARANERRCSYGRVASPRQGAAWPTPGTLLHAHRATS